MFTIDAITSVLLSRLKRERLAISVGILGVAASGRRSVAAQNGNKQWQWL